MYQIIDSNNNIRQHHANNVDPVLMSTLFLHKTQIIIYSSTIYVTKLMSINY